MRYIMFIFSFFFLMELNYSQSFTADSLYRELTKNQVDSVKIDIWLKLAELEEINMNERKGLINKALKNSIEINYKSGIGKCYLSLIHNRVYRKDKMEIYGKKTLKIFKTLKDHLNYGKTLHNISAYFLYKGSDYIKALEFAKKHIDYSNSINKNIEVFRSWNLIGEVYRVTKNYDKAIKAYKKAIETSLNSEYISPEINLGTVYLGMNEPDKALIQYNKVLVIISKSSKQQNQAIAYLMNRKGQVYLKQNDFRQAAFFFNKSLNIYTNINLDIGIVLASSSLAKLYYRKKDIKSSNLYGELAIDKALSAGYLSEGIDDVCKIISKNYQTLDNFKKAYHYNVIYKTVRDSLFGPKKNIALAKRQIKLETEKQEAQIGLLEKQNEIDKELILKQNIIAGVSIFIAFILAILIYFLNKNNKAKHKINNILDHQKNEISRQTKELAISNRMLLKMNTNLENQVKKRKNEIEIQLNKLSEYAFINAHHLRGPLARILGLINLMDLDMNLDNKKNYMSKLKTESNELDYIINEINNMLADSLLDKK